MNYEGNGFGMSVGKNSGGRIGVIVGDIVSDLFGCILSGIEDRGIGKGYFVMMRSWDE